MVKVLLVFFCFGLVGCGRCQRAYTNFTGSLSYKCSRNGVEYVQSDSGLAISVNRSGTPITCE